MSMLKDFFVDTDARWSRSSANPRITFKVIGSTALMMLTDLRMGTTDSDIIETEELDEAIRKRLLDIAGPGSDCEHRFGLHLQFVARGVPLLPQAPRYHPISDWGLSKIDLRALDPADVAVSKLKILRPRDKTDISMLIQQGHITHEALLDRFKSAVELASFSARADDLPRIVDNFHRVERDDFGIEPTPIDLPDHLDP